MNGVSMIMKFLKRILLLTIFLSTFNISNGLTYITKKLEHEIQYDSKNMIYINNGRIGIKPVFIAEYFGFTVDWINTIDEKIETIDGLANYGTFYFSIDPKFFDELSSIPIKIIKVQVLKNQKTNMMYQKYFVDGIEFYFISLDSTMKKASSYISIRALLEPFYEVVWDESRHAVLLYDNAAFNRFKLNSSGSLIIHNYKMHSFQHSLPKTSSLNYIPVREFFSLMDVRIDWLYDSQLKSNYVQVTSQTTSKQILLYPSLNKAYFKSEDEPVQEMILKSKFMIEKQVLFIDANDLIHLLKAEQYFYNDLYNDLYFNVEF